MIHLGGKGKVVLTSAPIPTPPSPSVPSEFSDDVDHYFKPENLADEIRRRNPYKEMT